MPYLIYDSEKSKAVSYTHLDVYKRQTYSSYEAKEVKAAQELNKQVCGNCYNYEYDGYVFVDELGNLMRPDHLTSYFPEFIQRHGMKRMRFRNLRHSCASLLLANDVPLKQIQDWLGHSDFSISTLILITLQSCHRRRQW